MARHYDIIASIDRSAAGAAPVLERAASARGLSFRYELREGDAADNVLMESEIAGAGLVLAIGPVGELDRFAAKALISLGATRALDAASASDLLDGAELALRASGSLPPAGEAQKVSLGSRLRRRLSRASEQTSVSRPGVAGADAPESVLEPDYILTHLACTTRDEVLRTLSDHAVACGLAGDAQLLMGAFLKREAEGTTGMMDGFAIPHAKSPTVRRAAVMVAKLDRGADGWEAMDGAPVRCAIALLIPDDQSGCTHLKLLSRVAEALMDDDFRAAVRQAVTSQQVADIIGNRLG